MKNLLKILGFAFITISLAFTNVDKRTVIIDVGHGGQDNGVSLDGITEKSIALEIAKKIRALNPNSDLEIVLTRESDDFISLKDRAEFINAAHPEFVLSIHANSSENAIAKGPEIFISENSKERDGSRKLAEAIQRVFEEEDAEIRNGNFILLEKVNCPIALLEVGFLTNAGDREVLTTEEGQTRIAERIIELIK